MMAVMVLLIAPQEVQLPSKMCQMAASPTTLWTGLKYARVQDCHGGIVQQPYPTLNLLQVHPMLAVALVQGKTLH